MSNNFGPPPGHPHYMSDEDRAALHAVAFKREPEISMSTAAAAKYTELKKKIADARKQMEETAKGLFTEMSAELFTENPTLMSYSWTQYTPYFNDGDECVFRCQGDYPTVSMIVDGDLVGYDSNTGEFTINGNEQESVDELARTFKSMGVEEFKKNGKTYAFDKKTGAVTVNGEKVTTYQERQKMFDGLEKVVGRFLGAFEDEDMKTMFGDHMRVTVNRDGSIETEEYQHD